MKSELKSIVYSERKWSRSIVSDSLRPHRLYSVWTVFYQAPPSMGFSRQEYWSGLPFPSPRDLPSSGIEPRSPALWADSTIWATREACKWKSLGCVWLYGTLWTIQSMEFPRLQYLEWVAFPFSRGYSQPRDWTQVSYISVRHFTIWATREAQIIITYLQKKW